MYDYYLMQYPLNAYVGNKQNPSFNWKWYCETHAKKGIDIT